MDRPEAGSSLKLADIELIVEAVALRWKRYPLEATSQAIAVVLLNAGEKYTVVRCINGEFTGLKGDLPVADGIPKCPNGHVMTEEPGIRLGWVEERRLT